MNVTCKYCQRSFLKESTLTVHVCEPKKRFQEQNETGVQLGFQAYLRFYEYVQGSAKLKTFDDFATSSYYRAFVKFGRHCQAIRAINFARLVDWLLKNNKKIDQWCKDSIYTEYLHDYVRVEHVGDALTRAIEQSISWSESSGYPAHDYLRHANSNLLCHSVNSGRITAWVLYNCNSGLEFLERINQEQVAMIWPMIDSDYWSKKFKDYPADTEYTKDILIKAGW